MTTSTDRVEEIFQDARELQADALEMLAQGKIRNAAEKAWGATRRATDALILARTGEEPERTPETGAALRMLSSLDGRSDAPAWCPAITAGRSSSMGSAYTTGCASPSTRRSAGSARQSATSTTPNASLKRRRRDADGPGGSISADIGAVAWGTPLIPDHCRSSNSRKRKWIRRIPGQTISSAGENSLPS